MYTMNVNDPQTINKIRYLIELEDILEEDRF